MQQRLHLLGMLRKEEEVVLHLPRHLHSLLCHLLLLPGSDQRLPVPPMTLPPEHLGNPLSVDQSQTSCTSDLPGMQTYSKICAQGKRCLWASLELCHDTSLNLPTV